MPAIIVGSAIAGSGLIVAGVIVAVFVGRQPVAMPARPAEVSAAPLQSRPPADPPPAASPAPRETATRESIRPPTAPAKTPSGPPAIVGTERLPGAAGAAGPAEGEPPRPPRAAAARDGEAPAASGGPGDLAAPAVPGAAAAAALVAALPAAIDVIPAAPAFGTAVRSDVDLGPCSPEVAALLEVAIAQPAAQGPNESGRLRVAPAGAVGGGWLIQQMQAGLDQELPRAIATIQARDGRLTITTSASLPPGAAPMLARSVLLVRLVGASDWKPVRLVRPGAVGSVRFPTLGDERGRLTLLLPPPFAGQGLPAGSRLEVETERGKLVIEPSPDRPDEAFGTEIEWGELADGTGIVVRLRAEPATGEERQPVLIAETGIKGMERKRGLERQRISKLMQLAKTHHKVLADTFAGWDRAVEGLAGKRVDGLRDGEVEALFKSPLPMSQRLPSIPVSLRPVGEEFDEFLVRYARGEESRSSNDLPVSRRAWEENWRNVIRQANAYYPGYVQGEWADEFQQPLAAWWKNYRPKAVEQATEAAATVTEMAAGTVQIDLYRLAVDAVGPDGVRYVVPLLEEFADQEEGTGLEGTGLERRPAMIE